MAAFQTMSGKSLPASLTLFVGNVLNTKIVPAQGELVPFTVSIQPESGLSKTKDDVRKQANFQILEFRAVAAGSVVVTAQNDKGVKVGPLAVTIQARLELPSPITDVGALARLFLAEAPTPFGGAYNAVVAKAGMQWMRRVVQNRLEMKSSLVGSAGAQTAIDVIKSKQPKEQFSGFSDYPSIATKQKHNLQEILEIANDGSHVNQKAFQDHVNAAIAAARGNGVDDPCPTKLLAWRTAGAEGPGGDFVFYQSFAGQDFYTIPAKPDKKK